MLIEPEGTLSVQLAAGVPASKPCTDGGVSALHVTSVKAGQLKKISAEDLKLAGSSARVRLGHHAKHSRFRDSIPSGITAFVIPVQ